MNDGMHVILAFGLGWLVAQGAKVVGVLVGARGGKKGRMSMEELMRQAVKSGGMPSGHAASFVGASVCLGRLVGFDSAIFALAVCMTAIIIYDAVNVRYAVGQQGKVLKKMVAGKGEVVKVVEGHTVSQVIVGGVIGLVMGWLVAGW